MKNTAMACLILILAGCSMAPTSNGVTVSSPRPSPTIIPTAQSEAPMTEPVAVEPTRESDEMVAVADPIAKIKKSHQRVDQKIDPKIDPKIDMKERVAFANQIMKNESAGSDAPVVCDTKARRTPAGQLIYESSCH